jgi:glycerol kinase
VIWFNPSPICRQQTETQQKLNAKPVAKSDKRHAIRKTTGVHLPRQTPMRKVTICKIHQSKNQIQVVRAANHSAVTTTSAMVAAMTVTVDAVVAMIVVTVDASVSAVNVVSAKSATFRFQKMMY